MNLCETAMLEALQNTTFIKILKKRSRFKGSVYTNLQIAFLENNWNVTCFFFSIDVQYCVKTVMHQNSFAAII